MTDEIKEFLDNNHVILGEDEMYHWHEHIYDEEEITAIWEHRLGLDTPINPLCIDCNDTLDYINGFHEGVTQAIDYIRRLIKKDYTILKLDTWAMAFEFDTDDIVDSVTTQIMSDMEQSANRQREVK